MVPKYWHCKEGGGVLPCQDFFVDLTVWKFVKILAFLGRGPCRDFLWIWYCEQKWPKVTNIALKSDIFPSKIIIYSQLVPIFPKYVNLRTFVVKISRVEYALLSSNPQVCLDWMGAGGGGVKLILAMPVFSLELLQHSLPYNEMFQDINFFISAYIIHMTNKINFKAYILTSVIEKFFIWTIFTSRPMTIRRQIHHPALAQKSHRAPHRISFSSALPSLPIQAPPGSLLTAAAGPPWVGKV